ncbi:MAG TPA: ATP-binding domain-containing protein [Bacillus bacterium]|nr:ATP-binding domain-containing protein [Bacillus sp. (in: firmicutes)]
MITVVRGSSEKYVTADQLANYFEHRRDLNGILYIGYPIITTTSGSQEIDALLVSKEYGIIIFDMVVGTEFSNREEIQDELFTKMKARLLNNKKLLRKRELQVEINVLTYATAWRNVEDEIDFDLVTTNKELTTYLEEINWENKDYYEKVLEDVQAITSIRERRKRLNVKGTSTKGAKLIKLEESIANLDSTQSQAVIETVDGPQRIRGLAGSGKTIVLALKVAYLHANNPDWTIAVTFNTRSLKNQFIDLITRFTYENIKEEPNWEKVRVIHAWGNPTTTGIYFELCKDHGIEYYDFSHAKSLKTDSEDEFEAVCKDALKKIRNIIPKYDVILVDEAQDFSTEFLRICYGLVHEPKRLIYAYDELQNLNNKQMKSPEEIFGVDHQGRPKVHLRNEPKKPKQDIVLNVCYRNSRPVLTTAHALGFGIYRNKGLIQMFNQSWLWEDVGYKVVDGELVDGHYVKLKRTAESSPLFLENHSDLDDLIHFKLLQDEKEQIEWLANQISKNLEEDELQHRDIIVIHTDPYYTKTAVAPIRKRLFEMGINSHLAGVTSSKDDFFAMHSITFTSIYRAKGNEAAMVYVIDAQNCFSGYELERKRNILFTAITRSKAWVRVVGYGNGMEGLMNEFEEVKNRDFELEFIYPTELQRQQMHQINKDMTQEEKNRRKSQVGTFTEILKALENGDFFLEDLPPEALRILKERLNNE